MWKSLTDSSFENIAQNIKILAIDFDGVMTNNKVYVSQDGIETVLCSRLEGFGLKRVKQTGVYCIILSTETNPVVSVRAKKLRLDCIQAVEDKVAVFKQILDDRNLTFYQAAFIGNDINDLELLKRVALPVVVHDAHEVLKEISAYKTVRAGGDGAVRELCDAVASILEKQAK